MLSGLSLRILLISLLVAMALGMLLSVVLELALYRHDRKNEKNCRASGGT